MHYIRAVSDEIGPHRVAVLATESDENPWATRLPRGVTFIACAPWRELLAGERADVLARVLVQSRPAVIHNMNSRTGYQAFLRHGSQLAALSNLFVSVFCEDQTRTGATVGFSFDEVPACEAHLSGVFADNTRILRRMVNEFGFDPERLHHHPQPVPAWAEDDARGNSPPKSLEDQDVSPKPLTVRGGKVAAGPGEGQFRSESSPDQLTAGPLRVLWAGRMDRQKRPDLLRAVAERAAKLPIRFDVFGRSVMRGDRTAVSWRGLENVHAHGPFDGFASVNPNRFDVFLLTSQWEGMPNVLLEAIEAGLVVVASAVGGVPELVEHEQTGLLIDDFADVDGYVAALDRLHRDPALRKRLANNARQRLLERHTWTAFTDRLRAQPNYFGPVVAHSYQFVSSVSEPVLNSSGS